MSVLARLFSPAPWESFEHGTRQWEEFSPEEQEAIVRHFAPKIRFLAQQLKKRLPRCADLNELISCGALGLMEALGKFRPERGIRIDTFAESRIKGAMLDYLRRQDWVTRSVRSHVRLISRACDRFECRDGHVATEEELAQATGLSIKEVRNGLEAMQGQQNLPLDVFEESLSRDSLESGGVPCHEAIRNDLLDKLAGLMDCLTERERTVLSLYYVEELTVSEIAKVLHVTEGRVSQLRSQGLSRLRRQFVAQYGEM